MPGNANAARALVEMLRPTAEVWPERIKCLTCGLTSDNPNHVRERYCGRCHVFHTVVIVRGPATGEFPEETP